MAISATGLTENSAKKLGIAADIIHLKAEHAKHTGPMGAFISAAMKKYKASRSKIYAAIRSN
jgi:hypothetical protein